MEKKGSINEMMDGIENAEIDFTMKKKAKWKGQRAPAGKIFLCIYGEHEGAPYEAKKAVKLKTPEKVCKAVAMYMRVQVIEQMEINKNK